MNVHVPLSPAGHVNIQLVDENLMDRAVFAVYKHKTQENDKLYVNLSESDLTLTIYMVYCSLYYGSIYIWSTAPCIMAP